MMNINYQDYIDYEIESSNNKSFIENKTAYFVHYNPLVRNLQEDTVLNHYDNNESISLEQFEVSNKCFEEVLKERESNRDFNKYKISKRELSKILHYAGGYNPYNKGRKYVPSSGGFFSVDIFTIVLNSEDMKEGIYYFNAKQNKLMQISLSKYDDWLTNDVLFQKRFSMASVIFILTLNLKRLSQKYSQKAYKLSLIDAGHVSQNIYILSSALDLKVCATAGFIEKEIESAIGVDGVSIIAPLLIGVGK